MAMNWRYADHPLRKHTIHAATEDDSILGYCVVTQEEYENLRLGVVVDVLGLRDHRDVVGHLINNAVVSFEEQDVQGVVCMMSEQHPYAPLFRNAGFITYTRRWGNAALYATINLPGSTVDEKDTYSQALVLCQNPLLEEKRNGA